MTAATSGDHQQRTDVPAGLRTGLPSVMAAYRLTRWGGSVELCEVPVPQPTGHELLVEVDAVGLCHSDLFVMGCEAGILPYELPLTLGHEVAGRVVATGAEADRSMLGAAGVVHGVWGCGSCHNCRRGRENHCVALAGRVGCGLGRDGGLARFVLLPHARSFVAVEDVSPTVLAPLADAGLTAYHAIAASGGHLAGDCSVLVIGVGGLGHLAVQILRATTSARVVAVDPRLAGRELADRCGADVTAASVEEAVADQTHGGFDLVLDFVGSDQTMADGASRLLPGGGLVVVGGARGRLIVGKGEGLPLGWQVSAPFWGTRADLVSVIELARQGVLRPEVEVAPFADVPAAYDRLRSGEVSGRLVITRGIPCTTGHQQRSTDPPDVCRAPDLMEGAFR